MLRYDRLESVNVEVRSTRILLLNKILALAIFDGPIQSGFDQLSQDLTNSVSNIGGGGLTLTPLEPSLPPPFVTNKLVPYDRFCLTINLVKWSTSFSISIPVNASDVMSWSAR